MADYCSIQQHQKFQTLKLLSGLPDTVIYDKVNQTLESEGRFPELDELPNVNSEPLLKKLLHLKTTNAGTSYTSLSKITEINEDVPTANSLLNNTYKDLSIKITPVNNTAFVKVEHRPTTYNRLIHEIETEIPESIELLKVGLQKALDNLRNFYGVNILYIHSEDVANDPNVNLAKAFIKENTIYVNLDKATIDSPLHEIIHMFIGTLSFSNPALFQSLLSTLNENDTEYNREELFVSQLARFLTGQSSIIDLLPKETINFILYNIKRDIDTILNGEYSVNAIDTKQLFNKSLKELAEILHSDTFNIDVAAGLTKSTIHRILQNTKEDLFKSGELLRIC